MHRIDPSFKPSIAILYDGPKPDSPSNERALKLVSEAAECLEIKTKMEFLPTAFDWRVGVLDRRVLFVCKYFMAPNHWQVMKRRIQDGPHEQLELGARAAS